MTIKDTFLVDSMPVSDSLRGNAIDLPRHENAEKRVRFPTLRFKNLYPPYCNTGVSEIKRPTFPTLRAAFRDDPTIPATCSEPESASKTARTSDFLPAKPAFCGGQTTSAAQVCKMPFDELHSNKRRTGVVLRGDPLAGGPESCRCRLPVRGGSEFVTWAMLVPTGGQYDLAIHYAQLLRQADSIGGLV